MLLKLCSRVAAIGLLVAPAPVLAGDVAFVLTNNSSYTVKSFFTAPVETEGWQDDVFGASYLPAGNSVTVEVGDGSRCVYHMKFVLEDGSELIENGMNLCELDEYTLSNAQ